MKKISLKILLLLLFCLELAAQDFQAIDSLTISGKNPLKTFWLDINNDTQYELLLQSPIEGDSSTIYAIDWISKTIDTLAISGFSQHPIQIEDMDNNNQLDVVGLVAHEGDSALLKIVNQKDGFFEEGFDLMIAGFRAFYIEDWNSDGFKDLLISSTKTDSLELSVVLNGKSGFVPDLEKTISTTLHSNFTFVHADQDGKKDILVTSQNSEVPSIPFVYFNKDSAYIQEINADAANYEVIGLGDYTHDGRSDVFAKVESPTGLFSFQLLANDSSIYSQLLKIDTLKNAAISSFLADFNSDGLTDVFIADSVTSGIIFQKDSLKHEFQQLTAGSLSLFEFADGDQDGDLDFLAISGQGADSMKITYHENQTPEKNHGPYLPHFHAAIQTNNGMFLVWNKPEDDHTKPANITYDLFLGVNTFNTDFLSPNFDIYSSERLKTLRGNNFYENEIHFTNLFPGSYSYGIQPIDNSLSILAPSGSGGPGGGGPSPSNCDGRYMACGSFEYCEQISFITKNACLNEVIILGDSGVQRHWYSEQQGFLGSSDTLWVEVVQNDTLYSTTAEYTDCNSNVAFIINVLDAADFQLEDIIICGPGEVAFQTPLQVDSVLWYSSKKGFLGNEDSVRLQIDENDQVRFEAYIRDCLFESSFNILLDEAKVIITNSEVIEIKRGGSVSLNAAAALSYEWSPSASLNQADIANPVASPEITTKYIVKGLSANNCVSYDSVTVRVIGEAFIPELFTPNGDGKNDRLLIYGLLNIADFEFIVYDRDGNIVFKTEDANAMAVSGWDGQKGGAKAKAGLYFWQVRGYYIDGETILLNEGQKGKVLLSK